MGISEVVAVIGCGISILTIFVVVSKNYGTDRGDTLAKREAVDKRLDALELHAELRPIEATLNRFENSHKEHYRHALDDQEHFKDMEVHWSRRDRDHLDKQMSDISGKIEEVLRRMAARRSTDEP